MRTKLIGSYPISFAIQLNPSFIRERNEEFMEYSKCESPILKRGKLLVSLFTVWKFIVDLFYISSKVLNLMGGNQIIEYNLVVLQWFDSTSHYQKRAIKWFSWSVCIRSKCKPTSCESENDLLCKLHNIANTDAVARAGDLGRSFITCPSPVYVFVYATHSFVFINNCSYIFCCCQRSTDENN